MMINRILSQIKSTIGNLTASIRGFDLAYVVEGHDWSIKHDGQSITKALNQQQLLHARTTFTSVGLRNQMVHFGSVNTFFTKKGWHEPHASNRVILTWFHVIDGDPRINLLVPIQHQLHAIHTSCEQTKRTLTDAGIDENKIIVIPLGVDVSLFTPGTPEQKRNARERLGIAADRLVIGSFQKDGIGWGEGVEPKLIKGPDSLVETLVRLKANNPLVLLTGPARGYVKRELTKHRIDYIHTYLQDTKNLPAMYHALDLYLITSRLEGGPKSLLEAWASGVPVVSTRVGMVPDIAIHEQTVLFTDAEDVDGLAQLSHRLMTDQTLSDRLARQALIVVQDHSWDKIARRYVDELYRPLL